MMTRPTFFAVIAALAALALPPSLAARAPGGGGTSYTITNLGSLGAGNTSPQDINNRGQIAGYSSLYDASGNRVNHAFLWQNGVMADLGTLGGRTSNALGINDVGQVVGIAQSSTGFLPFRLDPLDTNGDGTPDTWYRDTDGDGANDLMVALPTLGSVGHGRAVNGQGEVAGSVRDPATGKDRAAFWDRAGTLLDLNTFVPAGAGLTLHSAYGINDSGLAVGFGRRDPLPGESEGREFAFLCDVPGGRFVDLGSLGGSRSEAWDVNAAGVIAGQANTSGDAGAYAYRLAPLDTNADGIPDTWFRDANSDGANDLMTNLGSATTGYWHWSEGSGVNATQQVVGTSGDVKYKGFTAEYIYLATLWQNGKIIDLNTVLPKNSGWQLRWAWRINDSGWIIGGGYYNSAPDGYVLKPQ